MTAQPRGYRSPYSPVGLDKTRGGAREDDDDEKVRPRETRDPVNLDPRQFPTLHAARAVEPKRRLRADPIASALAHDVSDDDDDDDARAGSGGGVTVAHAKVVSTPDAGNNAWAKPPPLVRSPTRAPPRACPAARGPSAGELGSDRPPNPSVASRVAPPAPVNREDEKSAGNEAAETTRSAAVEESSALRDENSNSAPAPAAATDDDRPDPIPAPLEHRPSHRRSRSRRKMREASPAVPASPPAAAATFSTKIKFQTAAEALAKGVGEKLEDGRERPGPAGVHVGSDTDDDAIDHPSTPSPAPAVSRKTPTKDAPRGASRRSRPASPAKVVDVSDDTTASAPTTAGEDTSRDEEPSTIGAVVDESTTREEEEEADDAEEEAVEAVEGIEVNEEIEVEKVEKVEKVEAEDLAGARESPAASCAALDASFELRGADDLPAPSLGGPLTPENVGVVEAAAKVAASEAKAAASAFPSSPPSRPPSSPPKSSPPSSGPPLGDPDPASGTYRGAGRSLAVAPPSAKHGITVTPFDVARQQREIYVPNAKVGLVIGKGGSHVVYFQHQSGCAIHIARDAGEIPGGVNYVVPPSAYADPTDDAVTVDGMRRITLLGGEHQTMMAADMIRRLVESSAERCDRTTERQHAIEAGHALPPLPPVAGDHEPLRAFGNARSTRDSFSSRDPSAPGAPAYVPGDGPYAHMPHNLSPFVGSGWGRDAASHVEVAATVSIPHRKVGLIIGRGGENIRFLQQQTRAHIQIQSEHDMCPGQPERTVYLRGARESCAEAARMIQVRHHRASSPLSSRPPFASSRRLRLLKKKVLSPSRTFRISSTECFASGPPRSFPRSLPSRPTATTPGTPPATNEPPRWEAPTRSGRRRIIPRGTQPDKATAASSSTPPQTRWDRELTSHSRTGATAWAAAGSAARPLPRQPPPRRRRRRPEPPTAAGTDTYPTEEPRPPPPPPRLPTRPPTPSRQSRRPSRRPRPRTTTTSRPTAPWPGR